MLRHAPTSAMTTFSAANASRMALAPCRHPSPTRRGNRRRCSRDADAPWPAPPGRRSSGRSARRGGPASAPQTPPPRRAAARRRRHRGTHAGQCRGRQLEAWRIMLLPNASRLGLRRRHGGERRRGRGPARARASRRASPTSTRRATPGIHTFRIPALIAARNGTLLAFAEGRRSGGGDAGDIDLVLKRSRDGGRHLVGRCR